MLDFMETGLHGFHSCVGRPHRIPHLIPSRRSRNQNVADSPVPESAYALIQISSRLKFWVCYRFDGDIRQRMTSEGAQVLWKPSKGIITALVHSSASFG